MFPAMFFKNDVIEDTVNAIISLPIRFLIIFSYQVTSFMVALTHCCYCFSLVVYFGFCCCKMRMYATHLTPLWSVNAINVRKK